MKEWQKLLAKEKKRAYTMGPCSYVSEAFKNIDKFVKKLIKDG